MLNPMITGIRCFACERGHDPHALPTVCTACGMPLRVDYDLGAIRLRRGDGTGHRSGLWRYRAVLPLLEGDEITLGEGDTPLLEVDRNTWVKDESRNPTGSFKARGVSSGIATVTGSPARAP